MQENQPRYEEDEIDLRELFRTIWKYKKFIIIFTSIVSILAIVYVFVKTPIYEATATLKVGSYKEDKLIVPIESTKDLAKQLNVLYIDAFKNVKNRKSWIEHISIVKGQDSYIEIKADALSNELAISEIKKVAAFVLNKHTQTIDEVLKIKNLELNQLDDDISFLKENRLANMDKSLEYVKNTKLPSLDKDIKKIDEKIKTLKKQLLSSSRQTAKNVSTKVLTYMEKRDINNELASLKDKVAKLQEERQKIIAVELPKLSKQRDENLNKALKQLMNSRELLEQKMQSLIYEETALVGKVLTNNYPIKPKKKLIVVVAFVTAFMLSIFLVFFMEFIKSFKEENDRIN